jgi:hypothetical protein
VHDAVQRLKCVVEIRNKLFIYYFRVQATRFWCNKPTSSDHTKNEEHEPKKL